MNSVSEGFAYLQVLSRSTAAAIDLMGSAFGRIVESGRLSGCNYIPLEQHQPCWAYMICDLNAIAARKGSSGGIGAGLMAMQAQLVAEWNRKKTEQSIGISFSKAAARFTMTLRTLQRVTEMGHQRAKQMR